MDDGGSRMVEGVMIGHYVACGDMRGYDFHKGMKNITKVSK